MRMYDIIDKKKRGETLTKDEIDFFVSGYTNGSIPDYQAAALCMAIYFRGMTDKETTFLTLAVRDSGDTLSFSTGGVRVDKHSTGGVGDKTSLVVAPVVAALGIKVAKMSGRGLGHTGGTIDKLESIDGFDCNLNSVQFQNAVAQAGIAIVGQSANLAPADKKLYALRDVTATVDSIPLIASSIMGKKLAVDDDCIVLDVKCGSGSFMKTLDKSRDLARLMVNIGKAAGRKMAALITNMDSPLGYAVGNSLEVIEAINTLKGNGPSDFTELCIALASNMLFLAGLGDVASCEKQVMDALNSGAALEKFAAMVHAQGGNRDWVYDTDKFPKAKYSHHVRCPESGFVGKMETEEYGLVSLMLGAGRNKLGDGIDHTAGIVLNKKIGDSVHKGDVLATLYSSVTQDFSSAEQKLLIATKFSSTAPALQPIVLDRIF